MNVWLSLTAMAVTALAALFGIGAATIRVDDVQDKSIGDSRRRTRWASSAALAAAIATALQAAQYFAAGGELPAWHTEAVYYETEPVQPSIRKADSEGPLLRGSKENAQAPANQ